MAAVDTVIMSTTERDRPLAIYQCHSYVQDDVLGNHITYRCRRRGDNCLGRMHIYKFHPYNIKQHPVGSWRHTIKGDDWVVYESPAGDEDRMLVLSCENMLRLYSDAGVILIDGIHSLKYK